MKKMLLMLTMIPLMTIPAAGQEVVPKALPEEAGLVFADNAWQVPTPATAMDALFRPADGPQGREQPAVAVLRQKFRTHAESELSAMVDELVRIMLAADAREWSEEERYAGVVLDLAAAPDGEGTPSASARDGLIRIYETWYERGNAFEARVALQNVYYIDVEYVRALFESSTKPEPCTPHLVSVVGAPRGPPDNPCPDVSTWCDAGRLLAYDGAGMRPAPGPLRRVEGAPELEEFERLCEWGRTIHH